MHYLDEGHGQPILLVHGNPTWSFLYRKLVPKLATYGFRCVVPDLLGYGLSEHPANFGFTASEQADALLALVNALHLDGPIVLGQDWGGPIALDAATRMPASIRGIVLGSTFAWRSRGLTRLIAHLLRLQLVQRYMVQGDRFISVAMRLARTRLTSAELDHYRLVAATPELRAAKAVLPRELIDAGDWLAQLESKITTSLRNTRALLFDPQKDALSATSVRRLSGLFPNHVVQRLPRAGHFFQEDAASDVAVAIRERFG
jgi:haloalkane dehalogenase